MRGLLFAFGTQARENNEILWYERDENKGERRVSHRVVYVKYFGYTAKREGYAKYCGYNGNKQNFSANASKLRLSCGYAVLFGHPNAFGTSHIRCAVIRNQPQEYLRDTHEDS